MQERVAIITGAGSGIGRATSVQLASAGWSLVLVGRTRQTLEQTQELCAPASCRIVLADVADADAPGRIVSQTQEKFGRLDGLVNNAGLAVMKPFEEFDATEIDRTFAVNAVGPIQLMLASWRLLEESGGRVVNVSSVASIDPFPGLGTYGAAKAALNRIGLAAARECSDSGVRVFTVAPGAVETGMLRSIISEEQLPRSLALSPDDVAKVIVDCVSGRHDRNAGEVIEVSSPSE